MMTPNPIETTTHIEIDFGKIRQIAEGRSDVIPVVAQDMNTREVLVVAYVNREAWDKTVATGIATFWSTSRKALWIKGETSGNRLRIREIRVNCEQNSLLFLVELEGEGACHVHKEDGIPYYSCFYRTLVNGRWRLRDR